MNVLKNLPGPLLVFLGAVSLSFGGLIIKSFEGSTLWQILFWRSVFFITVVVFFLLFTYKKKVFSALYRSGLSGFIGGLILSVGFVSYVFAMYETTVANTNFIIQTQTLFLAIFGYIFLKETISKLTFFCILLAIFGIIIMLGNSISPGEMTGNIVAFIMPISFAILILIVRKFPEVDMIPLQLVAGIIAMMVGLIMSPTILISSKDIFLGFLAGFFQLGFGFIFITIGARSTPSALVGIIMLTEAVLGPLWAWMFASENPPIYVFIGGSIVITAVVLQFLNKFITKNKAY